MHDYDRILISVNFERGEHAANETLTADSEQAVFRGLRVAKRHQAAVTFAHVVPITKAVADRAEDLDLTETEAWLEALVGRAKDQAGVEAETVILYGKPSEMITDYAMTYDVDLVVIGTRTRGRLKRSLFGSTARRVMTGCEKPVLVAHHDSSRAYQRVVIASDLTRTCMDVIRHGLAVVAGSSAKVVVVHAVENWYEDRWYRAGYVRDLIEREHDDAKTKALAQLDAQCQELADEYGIEKPETLVQTGKPEAVIWTVAVEQKADLVVMGLVGRTGFQRLWVGDTADRVLPELPCSVLTIHSPEGTK